MNSSIWIFVIFFSLFVGTLHIEEYYSFVTGVAKILPNFFFKFYPIFLIWVFILFVVFFFPPANALLAQGNKTASYFTNEANLFGTIKQVQFETYNYDTRKSSKERKVFVEKKEKLGWAAVNKKSTKGNWEFKV